jgi:hypothetical protein
LKSIREYIGKSLQLIEAMEIKGILQKIQLYDMAFKVSHFLVLVPLSLLESFSLPSGNLK